MTGPGTSAVVGSHFDAPDYVATFTPSADLLLNTPYTATITTGAEDLLGNPLATDFVWSFTTSAVACKRLLCRWDRLRISNPGWFHRHKHRTDYYRWW